MKLLFLLETTQITSHIIYIYPYKLDFEQLFNLSGEQGEDSFQFAKENISQFLSSTEYCIYNHLDFIFKVGIVNQKNVLNFTAQLISDLLAPSKQIVTQNILIDDLNLLTHSINIAVQQNTTHQIRGFNIVLVLEPKDQQFSLYYKDSLQFFGKALLLEEQMSNFVSKNVFNLFEVVRDFEKKLNQIPKDIQQLKLSLNEVTQHLAQTVKIEAEQAIQSVKIYKVMQSFMKSLESFSEIKINQLIQILPNPSIPLNSVPMVIKPCQTLLINRTTIKQILPISRSQRLEKFISVMNPYLNFEEISIQHNITLKEINTYVTHILIHQKATLINKLRNECLFTVNPAYNYSKNLEKRNQPIFTKYNLDLLKIVAAFNNPCTQKQLSEQYNVFDWKCLMELLGYRIIKECEVYIYLKDPFITIETFRQLLKLSERSNAHSVSIGQIYGDSLFQQALNTQEETKSKISLLTQEQKIDLMIFQHLWHLFGKKIELHEIAWQLHMELSMIWKFLNRYDQLVGYYYLQ